MKFDRPFTLRIKAFDGESLRGFLGRLMERMGHPTQLPLWEFVGLGTDSLVPGAMDRLAFISGRPGAELFSLFDRVSSDGRVHLGSDQLCDRKIASAPRFCLECFREAPFHRAIWDIKWFSACPRHGCLLTSRCPTCHEALRWARRRFFSCSQDHSLTDGDPEPSMATWGTRAEQVLLELARDGEVGSVSFSREISSLSLDDMIDFLNVLGGFGKWGYAELMHKVGPEKTSRRLNRGIDHALDWPASFQAYVRQQALEGAGGRGSVRYLRAEIRKLGESMAGRLLREEFERALPDAGDIDIAVSDPPTEADIDQVSLSEIASELGYSASEIGLINRVDRLVESERRAYFTRSFVPRHKFEEWKALGKTWRTVPSVAVRWNVNDVALLTACQSGLIGFDISKFVKSAGVGRWRIRQAEIDRIEECLKKPRAGSSAMTRAFDELGISLCGLIRSIKEGTIAADSWVDSQGLGHARFVILNDVASAIGESLRKGGDDVDLNPCEAKLDVETVSGRLELDVGTVKRAYEEGFFGAALAANPSEIDASAVEEFEAKYIAPRNLVKELQPIKRDRIYKVLRSSKVQPANKALQRLGTGSWWGNRFYRRDDLRRLVFSET